MLVFCALQLEPLKKIVVVFSLDPFHVCDACDVVRGEVAGREALSLFQLLLERESQDAPHSPPVSLVKALSSVRSTWFAVVMPPYFSQNSVSYSINYHVGTLATWHSRNDLGIEILVDHVSTRLSDQAELSVVPKTGQTFAGLPRLACDSSGMLEGIRG